DVVGSGATVVTGLSFWGLLTRESSLHGSDETLGEVVQTREEVVRGPGEGHDDQPVDARVGVGGRVGTQEIGADRDLDLRAGASVGGEQRVESLQMTFDALGGHVEPVPALSDVGHAP